MKYIMLETKSGLKLPFKFHKFINHSDMFDQCKMVAFQSGLGYCKLVSAGFVDKNGKPYGRSETLNIDSNKDDRAALAGEPQ